MAKWLTSFFLLAVLAASALAGIPMHSGEKECGMGDMAGQMDCCAMARMKSDKPEVRAARLCCALNCTEPGTTPLPGSSYKASQQLAVVLQSALVPPSAFLSSPGTLSHAYSPPGLRQSSKPAYIRHLALLI